MEKLIRTQEILYTVWDNKDETLESITKEMLSKFYEDEYFKITVGRCYNESTGKNDSDTMFISTTVENGTSTSYHRVGEYIVLDYTNINEYGSIDNPEYYINGYDKETFIKFYDNLNK